MGECYL
ncbi:rCG63587 [Rattus norvegicus]|nr:rCG63587 [Rattus norvegicus]